MASSIMVMIFRLMFRKENLLQFNRLFLLAAILIPWSLPLVTLKLPAAQAFMSLETGSMLTFIHALYDHGEVEPAIHTDHLPVFLFFLYAGGLFFFLMQLMLSFISIRSLIRKCTTRKLYGQKVFVTQKDLMPFSFLNKIVISKNAEKHPQLDLMLDHERIHVKQRHTLDIIAAEVFTAMLWFSPFAWMLARDLKTNLEYLADAGVTANSRNMAAYQATLVSFAAGFTPLLLTNGFNYTQLKKRMIMMTKTMQPGKFTWKFVLVIPLLAGLLFAFCGKETAYDIGETEKESAQIRSTGGGFSSMPDPIFFIDGRRYDDGMPELDPNEIKSVQV
ncbi:MAG: M56 family metallopeptidase, partial [Bacteroidales bacterium]|nr:M56 family metallopeptidase [Bacteroidales bacterium]